MALLTKLFILIKATMVSLYLITSSKPYFIYLNSPETLKKPGIIHKQSFTKNSHIRYFYHFKNGTEEKKQFSVSTNNIVNNVKKGSYSDLYPEKAGAKAAENFIKSTPTNLKINFSSILKPEETISGIIEGDFQKNDTIIYKFGKSDELMDSFVSIQDKYKHDIFMNVDYNNSVKYRLGENINNSVKGQYGNDIVLNITPKNSGILKMSFSPRGGHGLVVYENRGKVFASDIKSTGKKVDSVVLFVEKDKKESFKFMPLGGVNYPIELEFSLHTFLSNDLSG